MAKARHEIEREFIETAKEKTGHDIPEWMAMIEAAGESKTNAIIKWLKQEHDLNHMQASMLAGIYLNDGNPVFDPDALFKNLFEGKESQRPLYEAVTAAIGQSLGEAMFVPTKTYVSLENERVFGCIKINKSNLRVGLDLGDRPFDDTVQQAKNLGAMPNISHMIELTSESEITDQLTACVREAYQRTHK
jgi:predicted transport protein